MMPGSTAETDCVADSGEMCENTIPDQPPARFNGTMPLIHETTRFPLSDKELVAAFLREDHGAIALLDSWINQAAKPYRLRLAAQWDDLLQDVRLKLFQQFRQDAFRGETGLKSYVWRVVNHTSIDLLRKRTTWKFTTLEEMHDETSESALDQVKRSERNRSLLRLLAKVSQECRQLWQMILDGYHYRQMSARLRMTEGALRVKVHRCRKKAASLRDHLMDGA